MLVDRPNRFAQGARYYVVLTISVLLEGASWMIAIRQFGAARGELGWWEAIRRSKDPPSFIVLFEDSAAMFGLVVAAVGITLSLTTGDPRWDGVASVIIGCALAGVALALARESKGLLIGGGRRPGARGGGACSDRSSAGSHGRQRDHHPSYRPANIFVGLSVDFENRVPVGRIEEMIAEAEGELHARWPSIRAIYIKP